MKYIIVALHAEARPFLDALNFQRVDGFAFTLYKSEGMLLCISGIGRENALMATAALLGYRIPQAQDALLNVGICAAPREYAIGELLVAHQLISGAQRFYPDLLLQHPYRECTLHCVDAPQDSHLEHPVDMESAAVFKAASRFMKLHQMLFVKIVSDHFEPESVTKEGAIALIRPHTTDLLRLLEQLQSATAQPALFTPDEQELIAHLKCLFTKSQQSRLDDALCYFRLKHGAPLPSVLETLEAATHKKERGVLLERLVSTLYE